MDGYKKIKRLAKTMKCRIPELLALAPANDPFYAGGDASRTAAEWFVRLWTRFGYTTGVHTRRVHYQILAPGDVQKPNGKPYENTENDWDFLNFASKHARHLGLVAPTAFVDRRNPEPHRFLFGHTLDAPSWQVHFWPWDFPQIETDLTYDLDWRLPDYMVEGYAYSEALQPYHLECWVEKSTMNDVLVPLCQRYGVNLVTGVGFMSITSVIDLLKRIEESRKPARILYISDFDPAGDGMPVAVARQIEHQLSISDRDYDIKLTPILLTGEQVEHYQLPRIPVKDSDRRKARFEERYGEGAVELDALEALHPGELAQIVEGYLLQFRDEDLTDRMDEAREEAEEELQAAWRERIAPYQRRLDDLSARVKAMVGKYQARLEALSGEMDNELAPYKAQVELLRQAIQSELDNVAVNLPELPEPEVEPEEDGWLFDSDREYFEQLAVYKARKNGNRENTPADGHRVQEATA